MKYLKKYNENQEQQDPIFAITKIKEEYPVDIVKEMLEKEIKMWEPEESDPDFYSTSGNGEAEDVIIEDLRHMFVEQNIDSRVEQALPLLARLQKETTMKEANIFEDWANLITEGTWAIPDTKEKQSALVTLLSQELPVGADAINATEQLYDLLGDDELFDKLGELAEQDANADARSIILDRLEELKDNHDIAQVIGQLKMQSSPDDADDENAADDEDAANYDDPDGNTTDIDDGPQNAYDSDERTRSDQFEGRDQMAALRKAAGLKVLAENVTLDEDGSTLQHILNTFKRDVKDFEAGDEMSQALHDALYDYYFDDMPYGVKKARTGDPYEWVSDRFAADLGIPGSGMNSPGIGPEDDPSLEREGVDYEVEGELGAALGGIAGAVLGGPVGAVRGAMAGNTIGNILDHNKEEELPEENLKDVTSIGGDASDKLMADVMTNQQGTDVNEEGIPEERLCNMTEAGEMCPVHGLEECWANTPAMKSAPDPMMSRLQTLSGFMVK